MALNTSIFHVDFSQLWEQILPPRLRTTVQNDWGTSLMYPLDYNNRLFCDYITGSTYDLWSARGTQASASASGAFATNGGLVTDMTITFGGAGFPGPPYFYDFFDPSGLSTFATAVANLVAQINSGVTGLVAASGLSSIAAPLSAGATPNGAWYYEIASSPTAQSPEPAGPYLFQGGSSSGSSPYSSYTKGDRVIYIDRAVYENISGSTSENPLDTTKWMKVNNNYIGAIERSEFNAIKLSYELALNRWFLTNGFAPVVTASTVHQGLFAASAKTIYIQTLTASTASFLMANSGELSSDMPFSSTFAQQWMGNSYSVGNIFEYTIWVPNYIFTRPTVSESIIRNFAESINIAGILFSISGYT